ncbi:MAG: hypothetical protein U0V87_01630 [Acidobacteriota bacterium]
MKKLLYGVFCLAALASLGCAITDYPVITDTRGDFSGVIRTGHKAYVIPSGQVATLWSDGSDELFTTVYQNNYGDQKLYTFNNFDPSGAVNFLDQTYCDWRYDGPEVVRAWNPAQSNVDDPFDYEFFPDASGARSLSLLVSTSSRIGECGDGFRSNPQPLMAEFANLATTSWRGGNAYILPLSGENTSINLTSANGARSLLPLYGQTTGFITERLQTVFPVGPNVRHSLRYLQNWVSENGKTAIADVSYGSVNASFSIAFAPNGINYNLNRF